MGTNAGAKLYVATEVGDDTDLNQAGFEALTWTEVANAGQIPEFGRNEGIQNYDAFAGIIKAKGPNNAGDGDIELAYDADDAGQIQMRVVGAQRRNAYLKIEHNDATGSGSGDKTATFDYLRVIISGPRHPSGGPTAFVRETYSVGINQHERVLPATIA